ncbi:hypothetical protein HELRODRAFT_80959 [Helobdella robusta]|uniref:Theromacin n=1 Tax=Helobdella robusta TaxID=6412 RepID=T1G475_HELRO|nr:hypothetical protein HELRODRAFT_80959 [Helobdella robusta]ESO03146.1 hypothetical protein HELRODRAFT_80959 [Helobdella robusta]
MKFFTGLSVLFCLLLCSASVQSSASGCYDADWSRCSPSTSGLTGIVWRACDSYCKVCYNADSGACYDSPSKNCPGLLKNNKQCACKNKRRSLNRLNPTCWP